MIAISTIGCSSSPEEYTQQLYRDGLFKNFEYMANHNIVLKDLMQLVTVCAQPDLALSQSGASLCSTSQHDSQSAIDQLVTNIKKIMTYKCETIIIWPGYIPVLNGVELHKKMLVSDEFTSIDSQKRTEHLQYLCRSLFTLCRNFPQIKFCIPTGRAFYEMPISVQEVQWILEDVKCANLKYWHNTASSFFLEKMKFENQDSWLEILGSHTHGVHLQDIVGQDVLCPPGTGEIKFAYVKSHLPKNAIKVLQISQQFGAFGIQTALDILKIY